MQLNEKFMLSLMYAHGESVIDRIEAEAKDNARLRWLLGGILLGPNKPLKQRIAGDRRRSRAGRSTTSRDGPPNSRSIAKP